MPHRLRAVLLDSGDTLVDEGTEVRDHAGIVIRAGLIPGAAQLVRELKRRGYPLALVADGYAASFRNVLVQHGLYHLFDAYAISEEVGTHKPHPSIFLRALAALGVPREEHGQVLMVGNNLEADVKGANALGMVSVWLDWSPRRSKVPADESEAPRYTIKTPLELIPLVESLEGTPAPGAGSRQGSPAPPPQSG